MAKALQMMVLLVVLAGAFITTDCSCRGGRGKEFRLIIDQVMPLVEGCRNMGSDNISIRGKCLVWDVPNDCLSDAYGKLPEELQATPADSEITVFLVWVSEEAIGMYEGTQVPGIRMDAHICVVHWPEMRAVGCDMVSAYPPWVVSVPESSGLPGAVHGDIDKSIADWILCPALVEATIGVHDNTTSIMVKLEQRWEKESNYVVQLTTETDFWIWCETKEVDALDLIDGWETVWFPACVWGIAPEGKTDFRVEVIDQSTGETFFSENFQLPPEKIQVIPVSAVPTNKVELSGYWPTAGHDFQRTGRSPYAGPQKPRLYWEAPNRIGGQAFIGNDGTIYFSGSRPSAFSPEGKLKWQFKVPDDRFAGPLAITNDETIYFCSEGIEDDACLYAVSTAGSLRWSLPLDGNGYYLAPAVASDGTIYVATTYYDGRDNMVSHLYAVTHEGTPKWQISIEGQISCSPAIDSGGIVLLASWGESGSFIHAVNPDGSLEWTRSYGGVLAISNDGVIYLADCYVLFALNPDGSLKWEYRSHYRFENLALDADGTVYGGTSEGKILAITADGVLKWSFTAREGPRSATRGVPAVVDCDGVIYAGTDFVLYALNPDGSLKWEFDLERPVHAQAAIDSCGNIYLDSGQVICPGS